MAQRETAQLLLIGGVAVGAFLLARSVLIPLQAAAQALTPQAPAEAGLVLRGRNYSAFVPFPDLAGLFNTVRPTDAGAVSVQPGQRIQVVEGGWT